MARKIDHSEAFAIYIANDLEPLEPFPGTQKPWLSKCLRTGKKVSPRFTKVRIYGHRCSACARSFTDVEVALKEMKTRGFLPISSFPGANKPWKSICQICGKETSPTLSSVRKGTGCKFCSNRAVDPKDAENKMSQRGFLPLEPYPGATKAWKVKCLKCGKKFTTYFHSLKTTKSCKYCAGVSIDDSKFKEVFKKLKLKPLENFPGAKNPWRVECLKCHRITTPSWTHLTRKDRNVAGCSYCSRRRVDPDEARKFLLQIGIEAIDDYPGGKKKWKSKCKKCGEIIFPRWDDLRQGQGGCSNCASYGVNYEQSGFLYLITHKELQAHKVGIANNNKPKNLDNRMNQHRKNGWILYKKYEFEKLRDAYKIEQQVISWFRIELDLSIFLAESQMPQGGWTETVDGSEIDLEPIWDKIMSLIKKNGN